MKALTIIQPWASAIACGAKRIETRSWSMAYRGPLLIHAAKYRLNSDECRAIADVPAFWELAAKAGFNGRLYSWINSLPLGALIAVAELVACLPITADWRPGLNLIYPRDNCGDHSLYQLDEQELALGDFTAGRYGWVLANVRAFQTPIPYRGRQGLFEVPAEIIPEEYR